MFLRERVRELTLMTPKREERIRVLLAEYEASYRNRDHYDTLNWIMGSIFLAASLALLGISFQEKIEYNQTAVWAMALFSIISVLTWFSWSRHIQPWIDYSITRLHDIEKELRGLGFSITLHTTIQARDRRESREGKGKWHMFFFVFTLLVSWTARVMLLYFSLLALVIWFALISGIGIFIYNKLFDH